jgi:hypothetical protein
MPNGSLNPISLGTLQAMIQSYSGSRVSSEKRVAGMPILHSSPTASHADVAICVGGGNDPISEVEAAMNLCDAAKKTWETFVCNDMIGLFPYPIDNAVTLHPDKMHGWVNQRIKNNLPMPILRYWAHRPYRGFSHNTRDWQSSSGGFCVKIAREKNDFRDGYTHVIMCGIPMSAEGDHFVRHQPWNAAQGFIRGFGRAVAGLRPYVRSLSGGWSGQQFGEPTYEWLTENIPEKNFMRNSTEGLKA